MTMRWMYALVVLALCAGCAGDGASTADPLRTESPLAGSPVPGGLPQSAPSLVGTWESEPNAMADLYGDGVFLFFTFRADGTFSGGLRSSTMEMSKPHQLSGTYVVDGARIDVSGDWGATTATFRVEGAELMLVGSDGDRGVLHRR